MKSLRIISVALLIFIGINAMIAGSLFIYDPSGILMGMSTDYLQFSPFQTYLIPGIILFVINGILNAFTAYWCIKKKSFYPIMIMFQGVMLIGWIAIQVLMVRDFNTLHGAMLTIGAILFLCGLLLRYMIKRSHQ